MGNERASWRSQYSLTEKPDLCCLNTQDSLEGVVVHVFLLSFADGESSQGRMPGQELFLVKILPGVLICYLRPPVGPGKYGSKLSKEFCKGRRTLSSVAYLWS